MKKNIIIIASIILGITLIIGSTYAVYTWGVNLKIKGVGNCFDVVYVKGNDIGSNENKKTLMLGSSYTDGLSTTVEVKVKDNCNTIKGKGYLYLNTDSTTSSDLLTSGALKYQVIDGNNISSSGTITTTGKLKILDGFDITRNDKALIIYVWIDGEYVTNDNYTNIIASTYSGSVSMEVESR